MKPTIRLLTISSVIFLMLFTTCGELFLHDIHHKLPDKYKTLVKDFDTVIFQSGALTDTFLVRKVTNSTYQEALSGTSCKGPYEYWEFEKLYYFAIQDFYMGNCFKGNYSNTKYGECADWLPLCGTHLSVGYGITDYQPTVYKENRFDYSETIGNYVIGNKSYTDVMVFLSKTNDTEYVKVYFNYKCGILKYEKNNNIYEIITK